MSDWFPTFRRFNLDPSPLRAWWPRRSTSRQQAALLRLLAVATEQRIALAPLVAAWAQDERGVQKHRLIRLYQLLSTGASLPDAVEQTKALSEEQTLAIRFGVQSGTLVASLQEASDNARPVVENPFRSLRSTLAYAGVMTALFALISAFIAVKIVPAMVEILGDYSLEAPNALILSVRLMRFVEQFWWLFALALLAGVWSLFSERPGRFIRQNIGERISRSLRDRRASDVIENLGVAAESGRPISGALSTLARYHFHPAMRTKLLFVRNEVEQGAEVWTSLANAGVLNSAEARLLDSADRLGNRAWALKRIASTKRSRIARRLDRASQWLLPAIVLIFGAFVLLQGLAMFLPLTQFVMSNL